MPTGLGPSGFGINRGVRHTLKDWVVIAGIVGPVLTGGFYVHDIKRDVAELGTDYRTHVVEQQETTLLERKWKLEDRIKAKPEDEDAKRQLEIVDGQLMKNQMQQQQLKGGTN